MAYEEMGTLRMVMPSQELFLDVELLVVPAWMPPVSIEDNAFLHDNLMRFLDELTVACDCEIFGESLLPIIATCWRRRLPLKGVDIWPLLSAHGIGPHLEVSFIGHFDFGTKLLTSAQGRTAVKRRRMLAMSKGRYLTKV